MILRSPITLEEIAAPAVEWLPSCAYFRCPQTDLEFIDPIPASCPVFPDFSAYGDELLGKARAQILETIQPTERFALNWAKRHVPAGAPVVELFAESGRFAWLLRDAGYAPLLADPLPNHVAALQKHGFPASVGMLPTLDPQRPQPAAVFILESIVRLPQPREFIEQVRARFPEASILVTAPSKRRPLKLPLINHRGGYPPDFVTRWSQRSLQALLTHAGYPRARAHSVSPMLTRLTPWTRPKRLLFNLGWSSILRAAGEYEFSVAAEGIARD